MEKTKKLPTPLTFHDWLKQTFTWVDNDVKRYMQRSWTASTKAANKRNEATHNALKKENDEYRALLEKLREKMQYEDFFTDEYLDIDNLLTKHIK